MSERTLQQILEEKGYNTRLEYIQDIADENGLELDTALELADILGDEELFDGFVSSCQDYESMAEYAELLFG